jgi:hypothetical protein
LSISAPWFLFAVPVAGPVLCLWCGPVTAIVAVIRRRKQIQGQPWAAFFPSIILMGCIKAIADRAFSPAKKHDGTLPRQEFVPFCSIKFQFVSATALRPPLKPAGTMEKQGKPAKQERPYTETI